MQVEHMETKTAIISIDDLKSDDLPALRQALGTLPGIQSLDFSLERKVAVIDFDPPAVEVVLQEQHGGSGEVCR